MGFFIEVLINGLLVGIMYSLVAMGFALIYKASDVFNFAQGDFSLFAGLALVGFLELGLPVWLSLICTMAVMTVLAYSTVFIIFRFQIFFIGCIEQGRHDDRRAAQVRHLVFGEELAQRRVVLVHRHGRQHGTAVRAVQPRHLRRRVVGGHRQVFELEVAAPQHAHRALEGASELVVYPYCWS